MSPVHLLREYLRSLILLSPSTAKVIIDEANGLLRDVERPQHLLPRGSVEITAIAKREVSAMQESSKAPTVVNPWPMPWERQGAEEAQVVSTVKSSKLGTDTLRVARAWVRPRWGLAVLCFVVSSVLGLAGTWWALNDRQTVAMNRPLAAPVVNAISPAPAVDNDELAPLPVPTRAKREVAKDKKPKSARRNVDPYATRD